MAVIAKAPTPANVWQGPIDLYIDLAAPTTHTPPTQADEIALDGSGQPATLQLAVTGATNATPIQVTVGSAAGLANGDLVTVAAVGGNTNANGIWTIGGLTGTTFNLLGSVGNSAYTSGGTVNQGAHAGLLEGPTTVTVAPKLEDIGSDNFEGPHDAAGVSLGVEVDTVMKETDLAKLLAMACNQNYGNFAYLANTQALQFGGVQSAAMKKRRLMFAGPNRNSSTKWIYFFLFAGYNDAPIQITFSRAKANLWKVKFVGLADLTRLAGDEVAHLVRFQ